MVITSQKYQSLYHLFLTLTPRKLLRQIGKIILKMDLYSIKSSASPIKKLVDPSNIKNNLLSNIKSFDNPKIIKEPKIEIINPENIAIPPNLTIGVLWSFLSLENLKNPFY